MVQERFFFFQCPFILHMTFYFQPGGVIFYFSMVVMGTVLVSKPDNRLLKVSLCKLKEYIIAPACPEVLQPNQYGV